MRGGTISGATMTIVLAACSGGGESSPPPRAVERAALEFQAPASRAGRLVLTEGQLRFVSCGESGEGVVLEDPGNGEATSLLQEFGAGESGIPVAVRIEGNRLQEIRYAGPEGPGCDRLPAEGEVEARGNEPFWFVRVDGDHAWIRTPEEPDSVGYGDGRWSQPAPGRWTYHAVGQAGGQSDQLTLELREGRCTDNMSAARYPFSAVLTRTGNRMEGCALEGRKAVAAQTAAPGADETAWIVVAHRAPGVSAMSSAEAMAWHGRTLRFAADQAISGPDTCAQPTYREIRVPVDSFLAVQYRIRSADLGLDWPADHPLRVKEVSCGTTPWGSLGGVVLWTAGDRGYAMWDGVFFELRPAGAETSLKD